MVKKRLLFINLVLGSLAALLLAATVVSRFSISTHCEVCENPASVKPLPQNAFQQESGAYAYAVEQLFTIRFTPPTMQLPDLRKLLTYFGPNGRPDAAVHSNAVYFALANSPDQAALSPGDKLYITFDRSATPPRYIFSPNNQPTSLWMEAETKEKSAQVVVTMFNEKGDLTATPADRAHFSLEQKEFTRLAKATPWEIGTMKVDGTLLARQKAKWFGEDKFLLRHGGDEMEELGKKERIDFGEGDLAYSAFLGEGEILIWEKGKWQATIPGPDTLGKPLLHLKKVSERLLTFDLWNPEGNNKVVLNLLKSQDRWSPDQLQQTFRFVSARTRSQYVFEVEKERMVLTPKDWLVHTEKGWEKLDTLQEIDNYVDRKIQGPLFVFNGVEKREDKQVLVGTLFNASRTEMEEIELDIPQSTVTVIKMPHKAHEIISKQDVE